MGGVPRSGRAPVLGQAMSTAPKAIESRPLNTSSHSFSITLRS